MISLSNVTKRYGETVAVDDVTLEARGGELLVLIGPSGCGKTTTLKMMNRLIEPSSGTITVNGRNASSLPAFELRRSIGYAIQSVGLLPHLSVSENIAVVPRLLGWKGERIAARVTELLALIGLEPRYGALYPRNLSGGQAQRVGVARALAADPPMMLMDEPFGAVDPLTRERLQNEFLELQRNVKKTIVMVTHDIDEAIKLADRIALMRAGRIEQLGTPEELLEQPVNGFVRDFIGSDRGLKRLSRVPVTAAMNPNPPKVRLEDSLEVARATMTGSSAWVVDANGVLRGWLTRADRGVSVRDAATLQPWQNISISQSASVKEALSRMVSLGFKELSVTDDAGRLQGVLTLEAAMDGRA
jgi:osmoprotectant transport system ATP-binding protein